jgi:hypothetical protein
MIASSRMEAEMIQTRSYDDGIAYEDWHAEFCRILGGRKFVIARRTPRIVEKYGEDVVCLSSQAYANASRLASLALTQGYD